MISNWPGYIDPGKDNSLAKFTRPQRGQDRVHRGHQRQRAVLRQGAAAARAGRVGRPQHLRRHRLDGQADVRPRLPREARPPDLPTVFDEHPARHPQLRARPRPRLRHPLAERHDRDLGRHRRGARHHLGQRPLRPEVQGPGDDADRDARHRPAGDEGRRHRPDRRRQPRTGSAAIDKIRDAVDAGQIRRFTGNDYTEDITSGNAVASIGWSGDAS